MNLALPQGKHNMYRITSMITCTSTPVCINLRTLRDRNKHGADPDGFGDAVNELASTLRERDLKPESFITPIRGQAIEPATPFKGAHRLVSLEK